MGVLQYFDSFFEGKPKDEIPRVGDIWWAPTPEVNEVPRIFEASRIAPQGHEITEFVIKEINKQHFTQRDRLPIKPLTLNETEELIIAKAKKRPVIVLASSCASDVESVAITNSIHKRLAKKLTVPLYLVAPLASVSTIMKVTTFGPELVARIRAMHYPHLFCLPDVKNKLEPKSIVRLDLAFSTYLGRGCESYGNRLHIEPLTVLLSQFAYLLGEVGSKEFTLVKELVSESYP